VNSPLISGSQAELMDRVIAYDVRSSLILLAAIPTQATGPLATLLVDASTPLLGQTPALDPLPGQDTNASSSAKPRNSGVLSLARGEYVTVVGWLESDQADLASKVGRI
jgi:hypothetical protein